MSMFRRQAAPRRRLQWVLGRFREKGAISPETAISLRDLGLPYRFEQAMERPFISGSGIFVETNGKYYLSEQRLKVLKDQGGVSSAHERPDEMVSCEYCGALKPSTSVGCPNCSAPRRK